ncbi:hypothetical protein F8A10_13265 [Paracoccus kondratievae]|uniref:DUF2946 family protein n=1 Tax=Paracoccus kondratievae TaxID=135740 RepID=UPI00126632A7|nr:DUF2946 family protein [Paracoccus kondratievae]QFQ88462.1 hypothetical protein F8A10_13265 [Paracoccus kondratievae]
MQVRDAYRSRKDALRRLCCWLAVLPFLLFSLILPGTMLSRDAQGGITVVLCSGVGLVEMAVASDGSLIPKEQAPHGDHHTCDWSPHGQPLLGSGSAPMALPQAAEARLALWPAPAALPHGGMLLLPSARGPPAII